MTHAFAALLSTLALWLLAGCGAWAALLLGALVAESWTGGRLRALAWVGCPPGLRRALLLAVGIALVCEAPTSASVGDSTSGGPEGAVSVPAPDRATGRPDPESWTDGVPGSGMVTVRAGDSLWTIVASAAPTSAGNPPPPATVLRLVHRVHHTNRSVLGPDPDHIEPGQRLHLPWPKAHSRPSPPGTGTNQNDRHHHEKEQP